MSRDRCCSASVIKARKPSRRAPMILSLPPSPLPLQPQLNPAFSQTLKTACRTWAEPGASYRTILSHSRALDLRTGWTTTASRHKNTKKQSKVFHFLTFSPSSTRRRMTLDSLRSARVSRYVISCFPGCFQWHGFAKSLRAANRASQGGFFQNVDNLGVDLCTSW